MERVVPLNLFGMPFGLVGLATAWVAAGRHDLAPRAVGDVLTALAAVVWLAVLAAYVASVVRRGARAAAQDLLDPVTGPFGALVPVVALLLTLDGVVPHVPELGRVMVDVLIVVIVVSGGWYLGEWIARPLDVAKLHPGYFLPTVAGGLLSAVGAASVGHQRLAEVLFGLGLVAWLILGSMILARVIFGPELPTPLLPTLAIQVAPAAVATQAYFAIYGERVDAVVAGLAGYGLLMVLAQVRLLPVFARLPFGPGFWSFTFSWAAVATVGLQWLAIQQPAGWKAYAYAVLAAITLLIGAIAGRTATALWRRTLLPAPALRPSPSHA